MGNKFALDTADSPDVPVTDTTETTGQETKEQANQAEEETPDQSGQVSEDAEENKKQEETTEEKTSETPQREGKKYSDQFTTLSAALKAAENLREVLADDIDFKDLTLDQVKDWYDKNRPRVGKEGFKGNREKTKQLNKNIKIEEDRLSQIEKKFDTFLEKQAKPEPEKPRELLPPVKPVFDYETYSELLAEDIRAANKMLKEFHEAQDAYVDERILYEGATLGKALFPKLSKIDQVEEKITKREAELETQKAEAEESRKNDQAWRDAEKQVKEFISLYGDNDYDQQSKAMSEIIKNNSQLYVAIATNDGQARALFQLYQDAKRESAESVKDKRMLELEEELAALKNGKTLEEVNAAKSVARINQSNGGVTKKIPQKPPTDQEVFEAQMRGNSQTRTKYDIDH